MKRKRKAIPIIVLLAIVFIGVLIYFNNDKEKKFILEQRFIAHALGGIDGKKYTNSLEALNEGYDNGIKLFEVDLSMTSDNVMVARHDWDEFLYKQLEQEPKNDKYEPLTEEEFKSMRINNIYTPLTFEELLMIMEEKKDLFIVLDTKSTTYDEIKVEYEYIVKKTKEINPKLLNRIIPQIYNRDMLTTINEIYKFKNIFYTLYQDGINNEDLIEFINANKSVIAIIMHEGRYSEELIESLNGINVASYVHTINDVELGNKYFNSGVTGLYTDFLNDYNFMD